MKDWLRDQWATWSHDKRWPPDLLSRLAVSPLVSLSYKLKLTYME